MITPQGMQIIYQEHTPIPSKDFLVSQVSPEERRRMMAECQDMEYVMLKLYEYNYYIVSVRIVTDIQYKT